MLHGFDFVFHAVSAVAFTEAQGLPEIFSIRVRRPEKSITVLWIDYYFLTLMPLNSPAGVSIPILKNWDLRGITQRSTKRLNCINQNHLHSIKICCAYRSWTVNHEHHVQVIQKTSCNKTFWPFVKVKCCTFKKVILLLPWIESYSLIIVCYFCSYTTCIKVDNNKAFLCKSWFFFCCQISNYRRYALTNAVIQK